MIKKVITLSILFSLAAFVCSAQDQIEESETIIKYNGQLLDEKTNEPLPYANVVVQKTNKGTITNEEGCFSIATDIVDFADSLEFHYLGYQPKKIALSDLDRDSIQYLKAETFNLNETFVFANEKSAKQIVKEVLRNKDSNYLQKYAKKKFFIRQSYTTKMDEFSIGFKKSSLSVLNEKMMKYIEKKIPKETIFYTDFLANLYTSKNKEDTLKIEPIKMVSLKDDNFAIEEEFDKIIDGIFKNIKENEYWKLKTGIVGTKIKYEDINGSEKDSLSIFYENNVDNAYYASRMHHFLSDVFGKKEIWDFLYHTGNYNFELLYGSIMNGEKVYVINFTPKSKGKFIGKVYISMETYALVKAEYKYDVGKTGRNIHLFGIGYTQNIFDFSIYFKKIENTYQLKYYSRKKGNRTSFDRNISLVKKKKRFLIDKKLSELKVGLNAITSEVSLVEMLVVDSEKITPSAFKKYNQPLQIKRVYVDQFSDKLWKGYTILEPSKEMRNYKKIK